MKLSVLDQSPISDEMDAKAALDATIQLAKTAETQGYHRFWVTEHHDLYGLACPNPAVLISAIGAQTERIKLGAGAVLLPYYKPFHVAETYNMLATMYPDRMDLGIGRAPGGPAEASLALSDNYLAEVRHYEDKIDELLTYLKQTESTAATATPIPAIAPTPFLLGTSEKSATLAASKGMAYAFGHFMTDTNGLEIVENYRKTYSQNGKPYVIVAIEVICGETSEQAEQLANSALLWRIRHNDILAKQTIPPIEEAEKYLPLEAKQQTVQTMKEKMIIGHPAEVKKQLVRIQKQYEADELMIVTIVHDAKEKRRSYERIAKEMAIL